jgi:hypothetical protein
MGIVSFDKGVTDLRMYSHYGTSAPGWVLWAEVVIAFPLLIIGLFGMLNFWRFSRWCLVAALAVTLIPRPFLGVMVYSAYEAFFGSIFSLLVAWLITVSFWSPIADRFTTKAGG